MKEYLLIYRIHEYPDMGGGLYWLTFNSEKELLKQVNQLMTGEDRCSIEFSGKISEQFKIVPKEKITEWQIDV